MQKKRLAKPRFPILTTVTGISRAAKLAREAQMKAKRNLRAEVSCCVIAVGLMTLPASARCQSTSVEPVGSAKAANPVGAPVEALPDQASNTTPANAAAGPTDTTPTDIIVTASATAAGVRKMDAAFSAVSLNQEQLRSAWPYRACRCPASVSGRVH